MKNAAIAVKIALCALCLCSPPSFGAEAAPNVPAERIPPQRFEATILKVISAKDGDAIFRAYVVKWKDQEVVATDPLVKSNFKEGDTIMVLALNSAYPQGRESYRLLSFTVVPPVGQKG